MGQECSKDGGDTFIQLQSTELTPQISKIFEPWGCSWNHDVEADMEGKPAMHRAAMSGNCREISTLVARGADVDLVNAVRVRAMCLKSECNPSSFRSMIAARVPFTWLRCMAKRRL